MGDDLFKAERTRHTSGRMNVSLGNLSAVVKRINKLGSAAEVAVQRTVSDFASRAPGWVRTGIREHYGVDNAAIMGATKGKKRGKTRIKVKGTIVDGVELLYQGRTLTPTHFNMSPKTPPTAQSKKAVRIPGQAINAEGGPVAMVYPLKPYKVKATIIKGQRVNLPAGTFVAPGKGGVALPFQRATDKRLPIEAIHTLSVPQMIDGRAHDTIQEKIDEGLSKRVENHIKQAMK